MVFCSRNPVIAMYADTYLQTPFNSYPAKVEYRVRSW